MSEQKPRKETSVFQVKTPWPHQPLVISAERPQCHASTRKPPANHRQCHRGRALDSVISEHNADGVWEVPGLPQAEPLTRAMPTCVTDFAASGEAQKRPLRQPSRVGSCNAAWKFRPIRAVQRVDHLLVVRRLPRVVTTRPWVCATGGTRRAVCPGQMPTSENESGGSRRASTPVDAHHRSWTTVAAQNRGFSFLKQVPRFGVGLIVVLTAEARLASRAARDCRSTFPCLSLIGEAARICVFGQPPWTLPLTARITRAWKFERLLWPASFGQIDDQVEKRMMILAASAR